MPIVSAFLTFGNPLPLVKKDNPPWGVLAKGAETAGEALLASKPDVILIYSTQWIAVLDELWQTRPHSTGVHVDENWYEYDLEVNLRADVELAEECISAANAEGVPSKAVNYANFPIDTGTIVANAFLNPNGAIPIVVAANNVYHDPDKTEKIGKLTREEANKLGRRAAVVAIGGLSSTYFDHDIDVATDRIAKESDDKENQALLNAMKSGSEAMKSQIDNYNKSAAGDFGLKHLRWLLGASGGFNGAKVHAYGATYGAGSAAVEFDLA